MIKIANKNINKKISIIMLIIMVCNFVVPKVSFCADEDPKLFSPIVDFFCAVGDITLTFLQEKLVGEPAIRYAGDSGYSLKYSPGIIFSGTLPAFDINFINPMENKEKYVAKEIDKSVEGKMTAMTSYYDSSGDACIIYRNTNDANLDPDTFSVEMDFLIKAQSNITTEDRTYEEGKHIVKRSHAISYMNALQEKYGYFKENTTQKIRNTDIKITEDPKAYSSWIVEDGKLMTKYTIYVSHKTYIEKNDRYITQIYQVKLEKTVLEKQAVMVSVARVLRNTIASWYKVMQEIALIGLLVVLVYVAIRAILSSSTTDKAKYKQMIFDWLVAVIIVFTLHYIISFTLTITGSICDIFNANLIRADGSDAVFSKLRTDIGESGSFSSTFVKVVMYYMLIILTIKYTIQYFKRFIHIAFLTMIGPLIGLTYPLDKIKDGQAQAFSLWLKEFMFYALMQPFHLVLYYVFIGSSVMGDFTKNNPFYALAVMAFLTPAEKLLKKMFGLDKGGNLGNVEAAFGGAAVMDMINNMGSKGSKGPSSASSGGGNSGVRMANSDSTSTGPYGTGDIFDTLSRGTPTASSPVGSSSSGGGPSSHGSTSGGSSSSNSSSSGNSSNRTKSKTSSRLGSMFGKVKNKASRIYNAPTIKGVRAVGGKVFTDVTTGTIKATLRITGAAALGTIGLAAGIATGEVENAFAGAAGGIAAGNRLGGNVAKTAVNAKENISRVARDMRETFEQGSLGEERAQAEKRIREFKKTKSYRELLEKYPKKQEEVEKLVRAGVTDASKIRIALDNSRNYSTDNAIAYMNMAKACPDSIFEDREKFIVYLESHGIPKEKADEIYRAVKQYK